MTQCRSDPAVALDGVRFSWRRQGGFTMAIESFAIANGERVLLTAPSGTGKSTLIALIAGISQPHSGTIAIAGTEITGLRQSRRDNFRAEHIGLIFQSFNLVPYLSALDNVLLPLAFAPARTARAGGRHRARARAIEMLDAIGLPVGLTGSSRASELSIGQQQRVAVLRALIGAPGLIVADEPTSALDPARQSAFLDMLWRQLDQTGSTLLMVSHDPALSSRFDRIVALDDFATTDQSP